MNRKPASAVRTRTTGRRHVVRRRRAPATPAVPDNAATGTEVGTSAAQADGREPRTADGTAGTAEHAVPQESEEAQQRQRTFKVRVAALIAVCSIAGVLSAWQASLAANEASDLEQQGMQHLVHRQQELNKIDGLVDQDKRTAAMYDEHISSMEALETEARRVQARDPVLAEELLLQAREEHTLARSLRRFFLTYRPEGVERLDGRKAIDTAAYRNEELKELRPKAILHKADDTQDHAVKLEALTALFAVSLFLLTLAELARSGIRRYFAVSGGMVVAGGLVLFVAAVVTAP